MFFTAGNELKYGRREMRRMPMIWKLLGDMFVYRAAT